MIQTGNQHRLLFCASFAILCAAVACAPAPPGSSPILLFNGNGTSPNDVRAIESILQSKHLDYSTVSSRQLNLMDEAQLESHRLLIVPGGNYIHIGDGIAPSAATNIHNAVQNGLNYLGICAGAILAGESKVTSFNLAPVKFDFYADVNRRIHKNAVAISRPASPTVEHYWEDGPQLTGWGAVVGKYPNGTPAIVQGSCGKGWVVLCGTHPEAPANWRGGMNFQTPVSASHDCAAELIDAALNGAPLPHY